jgi:uncharacterized protein (DUF697 family)
VPGWFDFGNVWKTLREVDLRPIRAEAERFSLIAIAGNDESAKESLITALCESSARTPSLDDASLSGPDPISLTLEQAKGELRADLVVLILGPTQEDRKRGRELFEGWRAANKSVVLIYDGRSGSQDLGSLVSQGARLIGGEISDRSFVEREFVPAVLSLLPEHHLSLARYYPLFRLQVAQKLISDTSIANASYSLSTGLAEIVPILDVPFNIADMIILTKAQAIMAYKLGLALGLSGNWQDHMAAFGSTIGGGFIWRQLARQLVGLIPVWGIIPKVAVAYAGTYVLGQAILQWYMTGRSATPAIMRDLYRDAFNRGKTIARSLMPRKPRGKKRLQLSPRAGNTCANCGIQNPRDFNYCGNCGTPLKAVS